METPDVTGMFREVEGWFHMAAWGFLHQNQESAHRPVSVFMASAYREHKQSIASRLDSLRLRAQHRLSHVGSGRWDPDQDR